MGARQRKQISRLSNSLNYSSTLTTGLYQRIEQTEKKCAFIDKSLQARSAENDALHKRLNEYSATRITVEQAYGMRMDTYSVRVDFCPRMLEFTALRSGRMENMSDLARIVAREIEQQVYDKAMEVLVGQGSPAHLIPRSHYGSRR